MIIITTRTKLRLPVCCLFIVVENHAPLHFFLAFASMMIIVVLLLQSKLMVCITLFALNLINYIVHTYTTYIVSVADRHRSPSLPLVKHNRVGTVLFILTAVRKRDLKTDNKNQLPLWEHWWNKVGSRLWMSIFVKLSIAVRKFATF